MDALKLDRTPVEGRPMYISKCEEKSSRKPQFKVSLSHFSQICKNYPDSTVQVLRLILCVNVSK